MLSSTMSDEYVSYLMIECLSCWVDKVDPGSIPGQDSFTMVKDCLSQSTFRVCSSLMAPMPNPDPKTTPFVRHYLSTLLEALSFQNAYEY